METAIQIFVFLFIVYQYFIILGLKDDKQTLQSENKIWEDKANHYRKLWMKACGHNIND